MEIEKINDNQIRCTLTHADLAERQLRMEELAYGSEKAKRLFHEMMLQASKKFGFEAEDIPLMIEAIPSSSDSIVLIITKVEDPDELDARFSKFSASPQGDSFENRIASMLDRLKKLEGAEEFLDMIHSLREAHKDAAKKNATSAAVPAAPAETPADGAKAANEEAVPESSIRFFRFSGLDQAIRACRFLSGRYLGPSILYKSMPEEDYILVLVKEDMPVSEFGCICNMLSEYGTPENGSKTSLAYLEEHGETIASPDAVGVLSRLS